MLSKAEREWREEQRASAIAKGRANEIMLEMQRKIDALEAQLADEKRDGAQMADDHTKLVARVIELEAQLAQRDERIRKLRQRLNYACPTEGCNRLRYEILAADAKEGGRK